MPRKKQVIPKEFNVPWITEEGYFDPTKFPIDSTLKQAMGDNAEAFRSA